MDNVDRIILERLRINCRTSLQGLSRITRVSANAVQKRLNSLVSSGIIVRFVTLLSPLMTNEDTVIAILDFESEPNEKRLLESLKTSPSLAKVTRLLDGRYVVYGTYFEPDELATLTMHLRRLPHIRNVEMYSRFLHYWGGKIVLKNEHKEILRCLLEDPRMSVSEIAKSTGILSDDVKEIIDQMRQSEAVLFTIDTTDERKEESIEVLAKIQWNVGKTSKEHVIGWLHDKFESIHLGEWVSAAEPTLFFHFSVKHVQEVEIVVEKSKESGLVSSVEPLILFPGVSFPDPRQRRVRQLLEETGFSSQNGPFA